MEDARRAGFLGPGPVAFHVEHGLGFADGLPIHGRIVDLGSGGGVPGLVLALARPDTSWLLLDSQQRRAHFLEQAVERLGLGNRATVFGGRAERAGRAPDHRSRYDGVVARSFGSPPVTAEAAAPMLRVGGLLTVSEPPDPAVRWPAADLLKLGLEPVRRYETAVGHYQVLQQVSPCPDRFPRREGVSRKRPLFDVSRETLD